MAKTKYFVYIDFISSLKMLIDQTTSLNDFLVSVSKMIQTKLFRTYCGLKERATDTASHFQRSENINMKNTMHSNK